MPETSAHHSQRIRQLGPAEATTLDPRSRSRRLTTLDAYRQAWGAAPEEQAVRFWLGRCCRHDSWYFNPFCDPVLGVNGLTGLIVDYPVLFPGLHIRPTRPAVLGHGFARYRWALSSRLPIRVMGLDFGYEMTGQDVVRFDADHRIRLIIALIDGVRP